MMPLQRACDAENQARAAYSIASELAMGRRPSSDDIGYPISERRYVWIPHVKIVSAS